ncbi:MAG TPA: carbamoyltransferase C-terminal domain-containing protein [Gemmatimonadaceae bacterium]
MNILGISGFEHSITFKQQHWPQLDAREHRISQGHDAAAALLVDGVLVAAVAEERINRCKHSGAFPRGAIVSCLRQAGLEMSAVDRLVHGFDYRPYRTVFSADAISRERFHEVYSREALLSLVERDFPGFPPERVEHVAHHLAHAASAYFTSGWDECLVVVVDGMGEVHGATVYHGRHGALERLFRISAQDSLGVFYSLVTLHLGFDFNADEYKIMGLAPYGDPTRFKAFFDDALHLQPDGGFRIPLLRQNKTRDDLETYGASRAFLQQHLIPARQPEAELTDAHRDVAAALQLRLDEAMLHLCAHFAASTGQRRLALAGGVALNCTANSTLMASGLFDDIYIQPAAGDDGAALGAALHCAAECGEVRNVRQGVPFLGERADAQEIRAAIDAFAHALHVVPFESLEGACDAAARLISEGRVVAWYRGRMEFGPRALGHRSILADPGHPDMRDRINAMVKMREAFRPFAPAVSIEQADRWFNVAPMTSLPFMIMTVDVRPEFRAELPAVTHVNGSARVQTVARTDNADFHTLLRAVGRETGREMVLNTSFNVKGQPIVNTPREAIETFLGTGIEYLFLENTMLARRD